MEVGGRTCMLTVVDTQYNVKNDQAHRHPFQTNTNKQFAAAMAGQRQLMCHIMTL
jgi:hypothetical protein